MCEVVAYKNADKAGAWSARHAGRAEYAATAQRGGLHAADFAAGVADVAAGGGGARRRVSGGLRGTAVGHGVSGVDRPPVLRPAAVAVWGPGRWRGQAGSWGRELAERARGVWVADGACWRGRASCAGPLYRGFIGGDVETLVGLVHACACCLIIFIWLARFPNCIVIGSASGCYDAVRVLGGKPGRSKIRIMLETGDCSVHVQFVFVRYDVVRVL
jgi:hypothetical protein